MNAHRWLWVASILVGILLVAETTSADAAAGDTVTPAQAQSQLNRPVVLGPDDKPLFPDPPAGFDVRRNGVPQGKLEHIQYDSKTIGTRRNLLIYLPPGYSAQQKYPVLYLLHGIAGNEFEWTGYIHADTILDNLAVEGKVVPMIVVMPNGRAQKDDRPPKDNVYAAAPAFAAFERELLDDVIPAVESRYSVEPDRAHRGLAGLSMGGGQTLNFGLAHPDTFAWLGAFSAAPNSKRLSELLSNPSDARKLKLLWLSCGRRDGLINITQGAHQYLKEHEVPHIWTVDGFGHDADEWRPNFYNFAQKLFRR